MGAELVVSTLDADKEYSEQRTKLIKLQNRNRTPSESLEMDEIVVSLNGLGVVLYGNKSTHELEHIRDAKRAEKEHLEQRGSYDTLTQQQELGVDVSVINNAIFNKFMSGEDSAEL